MRILFFTLILFSLSQLQAQISPPGLGETKSASWSAIGVKQKLSEKNSLTTYIGTGMISGEEEGNPFGHPSALVLNSEFYHKLGKNWKYSAALSYRRQNEFGDNYEEPEFVKQEFRIYGRISHSLPFGRFKWANTLRQEVRQFYYSDFGTVEKGFQLRTRLKTQLYYSLDDNNVHSLMASAEALFSIANNNVHGWSNAEYKEARFCFYYTFAPKDLGLTFDVGYMNNLIGTGNDVVDANYLAFDIIVEDPF